MKHKTIPPPVSFYPNLQIVEITLKNWDFDSILQCNEIYRPNTISVGIVMSFLYQNLAQCLVFLSSYK